MPRGVKAPVNLPVRIDLLIETKGHKAIDSVSWEAIAKWKKGEATPTRDKLNYFCSAYAIDQITLLQSSDADFATHLCEGNQTAIANALQKLQHANTPPRRTPAFRGFFPVTREKAVAPQALNTIFKKIKGYWYVFHCWPVEDKSTHDIKPRVSVNLIHVDQFSEKDNVIVMRMLPRIKEGWIYTGWILKTHYGLAWMMEKNEGEDYEILSIITDHPLNIIGSISELRGLLLAHGPYLHGGIISPPCACRVYLYHINPHGKQADLTEDNMKILVGRWVEDEFKEKLNHLPNNIKFNLTELAAMQIDNSINQLGVLSIGKFSEN